MAPSRLLALNAARYEEEVNLGLHSKGAKQAAKASGGGASGARRGRPPTIVQVGENGASKGEQMGLGLGASTITTLERSRSPSPNSR